jgi:ATPase subunit of ABC transporter with duplicated ATPase domains
LIKIIKSGIWNRTTLDPDKTVLDIVKEGVQEVVDLLKEYEDVNARFAEELSDDEMNKLIEKQGTYR